jgi:2-keto-4-pentenoate hydratase
MKSAPQHLTILSSIGEPPNLEMYELVSLALLSAPTIEILMSSNHAAHFGGVGSSLIWCWCRIPDAMPANNQNLTGTAMNNIEQTTDNIWQSMQKGNPAAESLRKTLTLADAYQVQLKLLARWQSAGKKLAGWKIGMGSAAVRARMGLSEPFAGYLLDAGHFQSGHRFDYDSMPRTIVESEMCFTVGQRLSGPGVTREQVLAALGAISPGFEIAYTGTILADMALGIADGAGQLAFVTGDAVTPYPRNLDVGGVSVETRKNGEVVDRAVNRDVNDDPLECIAWLANHLARYGLALEEGHRIITGSVTKPVAAAKGDRFEAIFAGIGTVTASFM